MEVECAKVLVSVSLIQQYILTFYFSWLQEDIFQLLQIYMETKILEN